MKYGRQQINSRNGIELVTNDIQTFFKKQYKQDPKTLGCIICLLPFKLSGALFANKNLNIKSTYFLERLNLSA